MMNRVTEAEYMDQVLPEYQGNPLIEALPEIMSVEEALSDNQGFGVSGG